MFLRLFLTEKLKPQIDYLWFLCYNTSMGIALRIVKQGENGDKPGIRYQELAKRQKKIDAIKSLLLREKGDRAGGG